jgi:hypothetical protein
MLMTRPPRVKPLARTPASILTLKVGPDDIRGAKVLPALGDRLEFTGFCAKLMRTAHVSCATKASHMHARE